MADAPDSPVTQETFLNYLKNPIMFPEAFKDYISDYYAVNIPKLPVSQIYGFKLQSVKAADEITALDVISATAYADASTAGPSLDHVPNGLYIALFGATYGNSAGQPSFNATWPEIWMSPSLDGAAAVDDDAAILDAGSNGRVLLVDFTTGNGAHTVDMKYKRTSTAADVAVWNRWLYLIKVVTDE